MSNQRSIRFVALLFCMALLPEYVAARPTVDTGARRMGDRITAGANHTCALEEDGTVSCWGQNSSGQLGDGTTTQRLTPVRAGTFNTAISISAGRSHTCALLVNGTVFCWGSNGSGRLGNGNTVNQLSPVAVSGLSNAIGISAGGSHTCALRANGTVACWGAGTQGQLGNGGQTSSTLPLDVSGLSNVAAIDAGFNHTCALLANGTARCWGLNNAGQLGDGSTTLRSSPVTVSGLSSVIDISAGQEYSCALLADGTGRCWGGNAFGQLGNNTASGTATPLPAVVSGLANARLVRAGEEHTCALVADGVVRCWGANSNGQLGDGTTISSTAPVLANSGSFNIVDVAVGGAHSCLLIVNNQIACNGFNGNGQLGYGTTTDRLLANSFIAGIGGTTLAKSVAANFNHTCAARHSGVPACWGDNTFGQLGDGTTIDRLNPTSISSIGNAVVMATGNAHGCVLQSNGSVRCWGRNTFGSVGDGTTADRLEPVPVSGLFLNSAALVTALSSGGQFSCALIGNGTGRCWGFNSDGRLGNGTTANSSVPVPVSGLTGAVAISSGNTGGGFSCALIADGTVRCWGGNSLGQLGDGTTTNQSAPVAVPGLNNVVALATGLAHACALRADGTVRCWGLNNAGQLGDGSTTNRAFPVAVSGLTNVVAINAGRVHTCALLADGTARCWGNNGNGKLGDGTTTDRLTPVPVTTLITFPPGGQTIPINLPGMVQITGANEHTCARSARGALLCWGNNLNGQLGDGTTTDQLRPITVPSFTFNIDPQVLIKRDGKKAQVFALAACDAGAQARIHVELRQGNNVGQGQATVECTGALEAYPVKVNAHGRDRFVAGAAQAFAEAVVRKHGRVLETQEWTRAVNLVVGEFIRSDEHGQDDD